MCQLGGWLLYLVLNTIFILLFFPAELLMYQISFLIITVVYMMLTTHLFRELMHRWGWLQLRTGKLIPRVTVALLAMSLLVYGLQAITIYLLGSPNGNTFAFSETLLIIATHISTFFMWSAIYIGYHYVERYNATLKYEAAMTEMTLNRLRSQLNPHFIFNALNSVRALVDENPVKAKHAITQLSSILRNSLVMDRRRLVRFRDELQTVKDYLALESIRFEERLQTDFSIEEAALDRQVPPMMLQTLVENGIKHGISHLMGGGTIAVKAWLEEEKLHIAIRNSGQYLNGQMKKGRTGLGLENTRERLRLLYGDQAHFKIANENQETVLTEIIIPR